MNPIIEIHAHAKQRATERGATEVEIKTSVLQGETFPAKFSRIGSRMNFNFDGQWNGKLYRTKQVECYFVKEPDKWIVVTVIVKYF